MQAIAKAADDSQRAMLLIMLGLADMMERVEDGVNETASSVSSLCRDFTSHQTKFAEHDKWEKEWRDEHFKGIPAEVHVSHHGFVARESQRRADDKALVTEAKKGAANKLGGVLVDLVKVVLLLAAGGLMHRLLG